MKTLELKRMVDIYKKHPEYRMRAVQIVWDKAGREGLEAMAYMLGTTYQNLYARGDIAIYDRLHNIRVNNVRSVR